MARRSQQPATVLKATALLAAFVILSGIAVFFVMTRSNPISKLPAFPWQNYLDGGNLWSQEDYALEGKVENVFLRSEDRRKYLASIRPKGSEFLIPVLFESNEAGDTPVQREQTLWLKVHLGPSGEVRCTAHD